MSDTTHIPYTIEQDEHGMWRAHAQPRPGVGASGEGADPDSAVADLHRTLTGLGEGLGPAQEPSA